MENMLAPNRFITPTNQKVDNIATLTEEACVAKVKNFNLPTNIKIAPFSPQYIFTVKDKSCEECRSKPFREQAEQELCERLKLWLKQGVVMRHLTKIGIDLQYITDKNLFRSIQTGQATA